MKSIFIILGQPRLPKGKKLLTEKYGEIGSNIEFMCDAPSDPKGKIQWYKNGIEIDPGNKLFQFIYDRQLKVNYISQII